MGDVCWRGGNWACVGAEVPPFKALELLLVGKRHPGREAMLPLSEQNGKTQMALIPPSLFLSPSEGL